MRKVTILAAAAAAIAMAGPAQAGSADGKFQVKVFGTAVLPNGKIDTIKSVNTTTGTAGTTLGKTLASLPSAPQTRANDNVVPTVAIEYFATPNVSVETICCLTQHHVNATSPAAVAGANLVKHVLILPATVTVKYHVNAGPVKPYVGVGPSMFFVLGEKPGATAAALGIDKVKMSNSLGLALQGGFDLPLNDQGVGLSVDAKKYFVRPTASFYDGSSLELKTKHKLDPWVLSAGLTYRF